MAPALKDLGVVQSLGVEAKEIQAERTRTALNRLGPLQQGWGATPGCRWPARVRRGRTREATRGSAGQWVWALVRQRLPSA